MVTGFLLVGGAATTYNHFLKENEGNKKKCTFFNLLLTLRKFLIPSTSKDKLWKEWETGTIYKDGRMQGIHEFSNWINEMQIKLIDKDGNQCISNEVK